jgi:hypothetical protein
MKHTDPRRCLSPSLLRHVRDARPTPNELVEWLGPGGRGAYHVLRKAGLLREEGGRVALSPEHLSADGRRFRFESQLYFLDEDRVLIFRD